MSASAMRVSCFITKLLQGCKCHWQLVVQDACLHALLWEVTDPRHERSMAKSKIAHGIGEFGTTGFSSLKIFGDYIDADMVKMSSKDSSNITGDIEPFGSRNIASKGK